MHRPSRRWLNAAAIGVALLAAAVLLREFDVFYPASAVDDSGQPHRPQRVPLGVLGDSDSKSYRDRIGASGRGGPYGSTTLQWTELLARLRSHEIDPGEWGLWGVRRRVLRLLDAVGLGTLGRPRKDDYRYNLAWGGARCEDLNRGLYRQVPRLLALMDREPERWRDGVIVLRIGIVSIGLADTLEPMAADPRAPAVLGRIDACIDELRIALQSIRERHPLTRVVLVGILDNADYVPYLDRWRDPQALRNIRAGLDRYDDALRGFAAADRHVAFFDDRAWFAARWGGRDARGEPDYRPVRLADGREVMHAQGDHPRHSVLADGHAGTVWNALWAQSLVELLQQRFALPLTPIDDAEVAAVVDRLWPPQAEGPRPP